MDRTTEALSRYIVSLRYEEGFAEQFGGWITMGSALGLVCVAMWRIWRSIRFEL